MKIRKSALMYGPCAKIINLSLTAFAALSLLLVCPFEANALQIDLTNYNTIDFGTVQLSGGFAIIDDIPYDGLVIKCAAGPATPGWTLNVKLEQPLTHETNETAIIPNTNFKWYVESTTGSISNIAPGVNVEVEFETYDKLVYTGSAGEDETDITMKFRLELPPDLQWGSYSTRFSDIIFTLTE